MIRRLPRRCSLSRPEGSVKDLLLRELLIRLSQEAGEAPSSFHMTNARMLVCSIVDRSISRGDFRGLKYLTDLVGLGEKAEIQREQLMLEKSRGRRAAAGQSVPTKKTADLTKAAEIYRSVQSVLISPVKVRKKDEVMLPTVKTGF
ncbi:MAG: hypothetical protein IJI38_05400 [Clostridia bacterium]|nr:hypothetical protein [Clostridia bacterium]